MMTDELDIEALLEAPFRKQPHEASEVNDGHSSASNKLKDERDRHAGRKSPRKYSRSRSRSPSKSRSSSRYYSHHHNHHRKYYNDSRSPSRKSRKSHRSPSPSSHSYRSRSPSNTVKSPVKSARSPSPGHRASASLLTEAQRDRRTVFCRQLAQRLEPKQLEEFCKQAGGVRDVKIVYDKISRRSKGVAYVEFCEEESVPVAVALTGRKLLGIPIIVELTETEKNRIAEEAAATLRLEKMNAKAANIHLFINNLHPSIGEADLRRIFQPFGDLVEVQVTREDSTRSWGTIQFRDANDTRQAADKMNGFDLAGRPLRIQLKEPSQPQEQQQQQQAHAEGGFFDEHDGTESLLKSARDTSALKNLASSARSSPCLLLQHLYDPAMETLADWELEIAEEVREECSKFGRVEHLHLAKTSDGDVFVRFASTDSAQAACSSLAGRWFGGKQIVALFLPTEDYLRRYPA